MRNPLKKEVPAPPIAAPPMMRLVMTVDTEGYANLDYHGEPSWAIKRLEDMIAQIKTDIPPEELDV